MSCQFEQGGRESEREGKVKENCESEGNKTKKRYVNRGNCHSLAAASCVGDARHLSFHTQ